MPHAEREIVAEPRALDWVPTKNQFWHFCRYCFSVFEAGLAQILGWIPTDITFMKFGG